MNHMNTKVVLGMKDVEEGSLNGSGTVDIITLSANVKVLKQGKIKSAHLLFLYI